MRSSLSPLSTPLRGRSASNPNSGCNSRLICARAQVAGQENDGLLEIHQRAIAQAQRGFVQDSQQQAHQRLRGLLDLVEKQNRKIAALARRATQLSAASAAAAFPDAPGIREALPTISPLHVPSGIRRNPPSAVSSDCRAARPPALPRFWSLPVPVGPSSRKMPAGRPSGVSLARYIST